MYTELTPEQPHISPNETLATKESKFHKVANQNDQYTDHMKFWSNTSINHKDIVWNLPEQCVHELENISQHRHVQGSETLLRYLPKTIEFTARLREELSFGSGIAIVDGFKVQHNSEEINRLQCKVFASLLSPLKQQNIRGDLLYDVKDKKTPNPEKVRKSITNVAQPFHTDGGWMNPPAKFIGLFCLENANTGGLSLATSLYTAFRALPDRHQTALLNSLPWDKQGEHSNSESSVASNPGIEFSPKGEFIGRFYESYVRNGYRLNSEIIPESVCEALTHLSSILQKNTSVKFTMTPGQYQFVNNWNMVHARLAFTDDKKSTRHLIRTWHA